MNKGNYYFRNLRKIQNSGFKNYLSQYFKSTQAINWRANKLQKVKNLPKSKGNFTLQSYPGIFGKSFSKLNHNRKIII